MSRLVIKNGRVIDPAQNMDRVADLPIEDGVIREIAPESGRTGARDFRCLRADCGARLYRHACSFARARISNIPKPSKPARVPLLPADSPPFAACRIRSP